MKPALGLFWRSLFPNAPVHAPRRGIRFVAETAEHRLDPVTLQLARGGVRLARYPMNALKPTAVCP